MSNTTKTISQVAALSINWGGKATDIGSVYCRIYRNRPDRLETRSICPDCLDFKRCLPNPVGSGPKSLKDKARLSDPPDAHRSKFPRK